MTEKTRWRWRMRYAIGTDGSTAKLPERGVYAATASGTQLLGGSEYDDEQPNIPKTVSVRVGLGLRLDGAGCGPSADQDRFRLRLRIL